MEHSLVAFELPFYLEVPFHCMSHKEVGESGPPGEPFQGSGKGDKRRVLAQAQAKNGISEVMPIYHYSG